MQSSHLVPTSPPPAHQAAALEDDTLAHLSPCSLLEGLDVEVGGDSEGPAPSGNGTDLLRGLPQLVAGCQRLRRLRFATAHCDVHVQRHPVNEVVRALGRLPCLEEVGARAPLAPCVGG